jgi:tellurite resistance protein
METVIVIVVLFFIFSYFSSKHKDSTINTPKPKTPEPQTPKPAPQTPKPAPQTPKPAPQTPIYQQYTGDDILINVGVLGVLVAKVDGKVLDREKNLVFDWIKKSVSSSYADAKITQIKNYVQYISSEDFTVTKMKNEMNHYLRIIKNEADQSLKYEILKLYVDIIIVDGILHEKEKASIYHIAKNIGVNMDKFLDQFHNAIPIALLEAAIDASTLGILPNMNDLEKKKILREQYRKWSDLVTSDDESMRRKAELMLKVISNERLKLKDTV